VIDPQNQSVFGISTERITRFKHDIVFPKENIKKYIDYSKIDPNSVTKIVCSNGRLEHKSFRLKENFYEHEMFMRNMIGEPYLKGYKTKLKEFNQKTEAAQSIALIAKGQYKQYQNLINSSKTAYQKDLLVNLLKSYFPKAELDIRYHDHEECHAISSYFTSPFEDDALLITMDAQGDHNRFSSVYAVRNKKIEFICSSISPKIFFSFAGNYNSIDYFESSVGGMYTYFTYMLGFTPNADEGKVEALAAFGNHENEIYESLKKCFSINDKTEIIVHQEDAELLFSTFEFKRFLETYKKEDISAAIQKFLEEFMLDYIKRLIELTGIKRLCFSGGIFANVILNLRVFEELTEELYIVPAMTDEGTAEGAAYLAYYHDHSVDELKWLKQFSMPYFGTAYSREQVLSVLKTSNGIVYQDVNDHWPEKAAELVVLGQVGAIFHGRMEWGPRALGNRSIIADCRSEEITKKINGSIKNRPLFQPFCPSILEEDRLRLFQKSYPNKHMTCAFRMIQEHRDKIPASVHVDGTGRAQFVEESDNPMYYRYLKEMKRLTGYGVSINTSFNKHGRTIVETPQDAILDFLDTNMDFVIIEGYLITRK
jgi:carbamoyltransferase